MIAFRAIYDDGVKKTIDITKYVNPYTSESEIWSMGAREAALAHQNNKGFPIGLNCLILIDKEV